MTRLYNSVSIKQKGKGEKMKISVIQMAVLLNDPDKNYANAKKLIKKASAEKPDVIVLPETFNLGFSPKDIDYNKSDKNGERTKKEIGGLAKELGVNIIAGSVVNKKCDKFYNTSFAFDRYGKCVFEYDKVHLFSLMEEDKYLCNGEKAKTFLLDGKLCTLCICYDIRFPELLREVTTKEKVEYIFFVSEWPIERIRILKTLVMARAIENQAYAICSNGCGCVDETQYGGNSVIVNPLGEIVSECGEKEEVIYAECENNSLNKAKEIDVFKNLR